MTWKAPWRRRTPRELAVRALVVVGLVVVRMGRAEDGGAAGVDARRGEDGAG